MNAQNKSRQRVKKTASRKNGEDRIRTCSNARHCDLGGPKRHDIARSRVIFSSNMACVSPS